MIQKRKVQEDDKLILKAAPASTYKRMNGDVVRVLAVFRDQSKKDKPWCYGFLHPQLGYGTQMAHGFAVPKDADYVLHGTPEVYDREEVILRLLGRVSAQRNVFKFSIPYKENAKKIQEYENILVAHFGFTGEALAALYEGS